MTIVCVDDHPIMLKGLEYAIRQLFPEAEVAAFDNTHEAMKVIGGQGCDILISEIELSGISGLTLAKEVKKLNPLVNIIFLTVCDEKEHAREVMKIKPSGYLVKPATQEQLKAELQNLRYRAS